ncbi:MAG: inositol 2-dehydrogenase [Clostridia bacterium]|nr:inositol 2-dehydrogenase [Clostridia bacterium]
MKKLRIALLGAGRIGKLHADNLVRSVANAQLVALADPMLNDDTIEWAKSIGIERCEKDPSVLIADPDIDAVFICSSTATHADLIRESAAAKKHIFCEKPIDHKLDRIREALKAVEDAGVLLQIGFVRRFDHNHKKVRDTVASGRLGKPHIVKVTSRDPEPQSAEYVKTSGGIFIDMTIHDFDMLRYLAGSEVVEVFAYGAIRIDPELEKLGDVDTAIVTVKFENGALGVVDNSRAARYGYDQRTEVHCDKGCVQVANDLIDTSMISTSDGVYCEKPTWFFLERYNQAFIDEATAFVDAALNGKPSPVNGNDGLQPVLIALAADKSMREGRPVKISELSRD